MKMIKLSKEIFNKLPSNIITVVINSNGFCYGFSCSLKHLIHNDKGFCMTSNCDIIWIGNGYDSTDWRNSGIEK